MVRYKKFHSIPIKFSLSEEDVAIILAGEQLLGVDIEPYFHRIYPYGKSSSHLIGYVSSMSQKDKDGYDKENYTGTAFVGKSGIEKYYENLLHGQSGKKQIERNVAGRVIDTQIIEAAIPGQDVYLNVDLDLQLEAESLLENKRARGGVWRSLMSKMERLLPLLVLQHLTLTGLLMVFRLNNINNLNRIRIYLFLIEA